MKVLGLKLTHDGSISISHNNKLLLAWELEKFENNNRFKILNDLTDLERILERADYSLHEFDYISIDGWVGSKKGCIEIFEKGFTRNLYVAPYMNSGNDSLNRIYNFHGLKVDGHLYPYISFTHFNNHLLCAYMTSPFSKNSECSFILVWDGGAFPWLFFYNPKEKIFKNLGALFYLGVNIYSIFAQHFGPFKKNENVIKDELSIAGKVMAYVGYGNPKPEIFNHLSKVYEEIKIEASNSDLISQIPYKFTFKFKQRIKGLYYTDEDILATFHFFLEQLLISSLENRIRSHKSNCQNLCYSGGAALNIKWNSKIRTNLGLNFWIPPFPNDSGSSIGAICSAINSIQHENHLVWNVYSGPSIENSLSDLPPDWMVFKFDFFEVRILAKILFDLKEPIIVLNGPAEVGPRALGNRSIIADATDEAMKTRLNTLKFRENYRPIAPICLEKKAKDIFSPGNPDPYMLFEHHIKPKWKKRIPAASHVDSSARLQTINKNQNIFLYNLLAEYEKLSSIPVLLNTSANYKGSGFFPDTLSAVRWGKIDFIWSEGNLIYKKIHNEIIQAFSTMELLSENR